MMEREGPFAFGEHGTSGKLKKKPCSWHTDGQSFIYHALIKSLSFVVHKSLILRSKWSGILKFRGVVRCEWNIFSNFAP